MVQKNMEILKETTTRTLTISLKPLSGGLSLFYVFINGKKVIAAKATKKVKWTGEIPEAGTRIKITVIGTDDASFSVSIDLPGIANDQSMVFNLKGGYFETEITI